MTEQSPPEPVRKTETEARLETVQALKDLVPPETYQFLKEVAETDTEANPVTIPSEYGELTMRSGVARVYIRVTEHDGAFQVNNGYLQSQDDKTEWSFPGTTDRVIGPKTMQRYAATERRQGIFNRTMVPIPPDEPLQKGTLGLVEIVYTDGQESGLHPQQTITDASVTVIHQVKGTAISGMARALNGMRGTNTPAQRIWEQNDIPKTYKPVRYPLEVAMSESVQVVLSSEKMKQYQTNLASPKGTTS